LRGKRVEASRAGMTAMALMRVRISSFVLLISDDNSELGARLGRPS
jgi:hypothetical protein